jgi:DNA-binding NtrC family response regulator
VFTPRKLAEVEEEHIEATIRHYGGSITLAAKALGIHRRTLHRWIQRNQKRKESSSASSKRRTATA